MKPIKEVYDWAAKDLGTIANRLGLTLKKAEKDHSLGEAALRSALKSGVLKIYQTPESEKLAREFESLTETTNKRAAKDDLIDALRYALVAIPIDWSNILQNVFDNRWKKKDDKYQGMSRHDIEYKKARPNAPLIDHGEVDDEFGFWNDLY
jgi:hypothetical protein